MAVASPWSQSISAGAGRASSEIQGRKFPSEVAASATASLYRNSTDRDIHVQPGWIVRIADKAARYRERLPRLPGHAHANQIRPGNQTVCRVIFDPTCAG